MTMSYEHIHAQCYGNSRRTVTVIGRRGVCMNEQAQREQNNTNKLHKVYIFALVTFNPAIICRPCVLTGLAEGSTIKSWSLTVLL